MLLLSHLWTLLHPPISQLTKQPAPLPPPLSILNSITVTPFVTTFQNINLADSNRSRTLLLVLLLRLLNPDMSLQFSDLSTGLRSTNALNINFFLLPTKFLQPVNLAILTIWSLFSPLAVPAPHLLSLFLTHHWTISSLKITDRSFRYASPRLWNQLPDSFRQPRQSCLDSPPHSLVSSSLSSSPLSSSVTLSLQAWNLPFQ